MARKTKAEKELEAADEVRRWENLALQLTNFYSDLLARALTARKRGKQVKKSDAARAAVLLRVHDLQQIQSGDLVAAWREVGRVVLDNLREDPPNWCSHGREHIDTARSLIGLPRIRRMRIIINVEHKDVLTWNSDKLLITISDAKGKTLVSNLKPEKFTHIE